MSGSSLDPSSPRLGPTRFGSSLERLVEDDFEHWTLDSIPLLSRTILKGALCLEGMKFPEETRDIPPLPPQLRLQSSSEMWGYGACAGSHSELWGYGYDEKKGGRGFSPPKAFGASDIASLVDAGVSEANLSPILQAADPGSPSRGLPAPLQEIVKKHRREAFGFFIELAKTSDAVPISKLIALLSKRFPSFQFETAEMRFCLSAMSSEDAPIVAKSGLASRAQKATRAPLSSSSSVSSEVAVNPEKLWRRMHNFAGRQRSAYIRQSSSVAKQLEAQSAAMSKELVHPNVNATGHVVLEAELPKVRSALLNSRSPSSSAAASGRFIAPGIRHLGGVGLPQHAKSDPSAATCAQAAGASPAKKEPEFSKELMMANRALTQYLEEMNAVDVM